MCVCGITEGNLLQCIQQDAPRDIHHHCNTAKNDFIHTTASYLFGRMQTHTQDSMTQMQLRTINSILQEQYDCTESLCNATTALHNSLIHAGSSNSNSNGRARPSKFSLHLCQSIQEYQSALASVHDNLRVLETLAMTNETIKSDNDNHIDQESKTKTNSIVPRASVDSFQRQKRRDDIFDDPLIYCLQAHVKRTRRILTTIYQSGLGASFHANGLQTATSSTSPSITAAASGDSLGNAGRLVSLATLRASIQTVTENLA